MVPNGSARWIGAVVLPVVPNADGTLVQVGQEHADEVAGLLLIRERFLSQLILE